MGTTGIGQKFAGYRIEGLIGEGGMGIVYLAEHLRLQRKVALKVVRPELAKESDFRVRFVREARMAAALEHPNIIPVHDAGEADGVLYLAMRYVRGTDLKDLIRDEKPLDAGRVLRILQQIASALDAAHEEGLVHRDVKPRNVLVSKEGRARDVEHAFLTDFGLTKRTESGSSLTRTGFFLGTLDYAAPEQIQAKHLDGRADQYALACMLYECLGGRPPFALDNDVAVMYAHLQEPPPPVSAARPDLPPALDMVIAKGMAKDREERYETCGDLIDAARTAIGTQASGPRPSLAPSGPTADPAGTGGVPPPAPPAPVAAGARVHAPTPPRPRRAWIFGLVAAVVAGAAVVVVLASSKGSPRTGPTGSPIGSPTATLSSPPPTTVTPSGGEALVTSISRAGFTLGLPADWAAGSSETIRQTRDACANRGTRPQDFNRTRVEGPGSAEIVLDVTPHYVGTARFHVHCQAGNQTGVVKRIEFQGKIQAFRWTRPDDRGMKKVEVQFEAANGSLYAILTQSSVAEYSALEPTFQRILNSLTVGPPTP